MPVLDLEQLDGLARTLANYHEPVCRAMPPHDDAGRGICSDCHRIYCLGCIPDRLCDGERT